MIDGFPRVLDEAKVLETALSFYDRKPLSIINLDTPEVVVRARMLDRARPDDTIESIEERLRWYQTETMPVIDYYRSRPDTLVHDIDGTVGIEEVHQAILQALQLK